MEDDMDAALWGGLPSEIVETALSYLSMPVLCRFRAVCKRWNSLICNPEFAALCIRNASQDASFLVAASHTLKRHRVDNQSYGWVLLDVKAKRCFTITKLADQKFFHRFHFRNSGCCAAMDGGLVCQVMPPAAHKDVSLFISNPIAQREPRLLPTPKHQLESDEMMVCLVADASAGCYTVFVLPNNGKRASKKNPFMIMYESATNAWRSSSLPVMTKVCVKVGHSIVCFNGLLYVLMMEWLPEGLVPDHSWLWSYNHVEDTWKDTGVVIHLHALLELTFLVSDKRLFIASWVRTRGPWGRIKWLYQVSEVDLQEKMLRTVLKVKEASMVELVGEFNPKPNDAHLHAFGLGRGIILLCQKTGNTRVYDMRTCTWDVLRESRLVFPTVKSYSRTRIYIMNLVMPAAIEFWKADSLSNA